MLQRDLSQRIPDVRVFMDLDSIEGGVDFAREIREAVNSSAVLVALIGPDWATLADNAGARRLDKPDDYVRFEIRTALECGARVIPVLIDGAEPLRPQQLPAEIEELARLNALELGYVRYQYDIDRILDNIQRVLAPIREREEADRLAREEAARQAQEEEAERLAQEEAARKEAERKARQAEQRKARREAQRLAQEAAAHQAQEDEAERLAREEEAERKKAERKAREKAERKAREKAERKAREAEKAGKLRELLLDLHKRFASSYHPDTDLVGPYPASSPMILLRAIPQVQEARDLYAAALPAAQQTLGPEHPDTLTVRANLAGWTVRAAADAAVGRDQYAALLPAYERVLGPEQPDTLRIRANLAGWTGHAGDAAGARDQFAALVPVFERVLGAEHPETLSTRYELAGWTGKAGNAAGARDQLAALLPIQERVLGPKHPSTMNTKARLRDWAQNTGWRKWLGV
jgi:hypothetical protein